MANASVTYASATDESSLTISDLASSCWLAFFIVFSSSSILTLFRNRISPSSMDLIASGLLTLRRHRERNLLSGLLIFDSNFECGSVDVKSNFPGLD